MGSLRVGDDWGTSLSLSPCNTMHCSPSGSSVHGVLQVRILEWVAISSSRGFSRPRDRTQVYCIARKMLNYNVISIPLDRLTQKIIIFCGMCSKSNDNVSLWKEFRSPVLSPIKTFNSWLFSHFPRWIFTLVLFYNQLLVLLQNWNGSSN